MLPSARMILACLDPATASSKNKKRQVSEVNNHIRFITLISVISDKIRGCFT